MIPALPPLFAQHPAQAQLMPGIWLARNWHMNSTPIWSRDLSATLEVAADVFPEPVPLIIEICVFDVHLGQPRKLTVSSPGHADVQIEIRSTAPVQIRTETPVQQQGAACRPITLTLDGINSPLHMGMSVDDRLLGLHIRSIRANPDALSLPLDMSDPAVATPVLGEGWARVELGTGVWSSRDRASLILPGYLRVTGCETVYFRADVLYRKEDIPPLVVEVLCNMVHATTWRFPPDASGVLRCPLPGWQDNTDVVLTLCLQNLCSPQDLGINADARLLGLMLREIGLEDAASAR